MSRYNVLYRANDAHYHDSCASHQEALQILEHLPVINQFTPIGIYDAKTELFHWEPGQQLLYNQSCISKQARLASQVISIAQSLATQEVREFTGHTLKPNVEVGI